MPLVRCSAAVARGGGGSAPNPIRQAGSAVGHPAAMLLGRPAHEPFPELLLASRLLNERNGRRRKTHTRRF